MRRTLFALALATACASSAALSATPDLRATLEEQLRTLRINEASHTLDAIINARLPKDGKPRADPELNGLIGRFLLRAGAGRAALSYLQASTLAGRPNEDSARLAIAEGQADALIGDYTAAVAQFDAALALKPSPAMRGVAARGRIAALLAIDPLKARASIADFRTARADDAEGEWEWSLLEAQADLLTGHPVEARRAADTAWAGAAHAAFDTSAPARVAMIQAAIAEQDGRHDEAIGLLAVAMGKAGSTSSDVIGKLADRLPTCGAMIHPNDSLTIGLYRDTSGNGIRITPLSATRPQIVSPFLDGVIAEEIPPTNEINNGVIVVTVRCRTMPSLSAATPHGTLDLPSRWAAARGILPRFGANVGEAALTEAAKEVDDLTARFGPDSPLLIGPLIHLAGFTQERVTHFGDIAPTRFADISMRIAALLVRAGGTESFVPVGTNPFAVQERVIAAKSRAEAQDIVSRSFQSFLGKVDFDIAYDSFMAPANTQLLTPAQRIIAADALLARGRTTIAADDRRLTALTLRTIALAREADDYATARRLIRGSGLPDDLCGLRDTAPHMEGFDFTEQDYPHQALRTGMAGRTLMEFNLDARGRQLSARILATVPAFVFEDTVAAKATTVTFTPALSGGRPVACRGVTSSIKWQFPEGDNTFRSPALNGWKPGA